MSRVTVPGSGPADVVTFGETTVMLTSSHGRRLRHAMSLGVSVGGTESSVALGLVRLGHSAAWMGRVGDDELGRLILSCLRGEGLDVGAATIDRQHPTGLTILWSRESIAPTRHVISYRHGTAGPALGPEHLDVERIRRARLLHVTGATAALGPGPRAAALEAAALAREAGVAVSFAPQHHDGVWSAAEARVTYRRLAATADIVLADEDEARMMLGDLPVDALAQELSRDGAAEAVITSGWQGAAAWVAGRLWTGPDVRVPIVDPAGTREAFAAGYLAAWLEKLPPDRRLAVANTVAGRALAAPGDWECLPERGEIDGLPALPRL